MEAINKIDNIDKLRNIVIELKTNLHQLSFFQLDRKTALTILSDILSYMFETFKISVNWNFNTSIFYADKFVQNLKEILKQTLKVYVEIHGDAKTPNNIELLSEVLTILKFAKIFRGLRFKIKYEELRGIKYDHSSKTVYIGYPSEQNKYLEGINSYTIYLDKIKREKEYLLENKKKTNNRGKFKILIQKFLESRNEISPIQISKYPKEIMEHLMGEAKLCETLQHNFYPLDNDLNLNGRYTFFEFSRVLHGLFAICEIYLSIYNNGWKIWKVDLHQLETELTAFLNIKKDVICTILNDLLYKFDNEDFAEFQPLILDSDHSILLIPFYTDAWIANSTYIDISKFLYKKNFSAHQVYMTKSFEKKVEDLLKEKIVDSNIDSIKLKNIGQIDRIISDSSRSIMILVEIKHLTSYNNERIEKGIEQLDRGKEIIIHHWKKISYRLNEWNRKPPPKKILKLLVTNWFRGTIDEIPGEIIILNHEEIKKLKEYYDLDSFCDFLKNFNGFFNKNNISFIKNSVTLFGYTFEYESLDLSNLSDNADKLM